MKLQKSRLSEMAWLAEVHEVNRPLTAAQPISVRHDRITEGNPGPFPEQHACCELNVLLSGSLLHFSQREQSKRKAGDVFLAVPGVPHYSVDHRYPLEWISVYFQPSLLLEQSPAAEAHQLLERVMSIGMTVRYIRPPNAFRRNAIELMKQIASEFKKRAFGSELLMRAILFDLLIGIVRSQPVDNRSMASVIRSTGNWVLAERALAYLHEHYAEPMYARDVAAAAGVNESSLPKLFRECLGMPWVQYLQVYRINRAAALLADGKFSVTRAAAEVGIGDLSHFTEAFRNILGVSPSTYAKRFGGNGTNRS